MTLFSLPPLSVLALDMWINFLIWLVGVPVGVYAFVHALRQRSDAFTAVDKLTKPAWAAITGAGAAILILTSGPASATQRSHQSSNELSSVRTVSTPAATSRSPARVK